MQPREIIGAAIGVALSPFAALGSFIRHARLFHPEGVVYAAVVTPVGSSGAAHLVGARLAGMALVRFSSAWWKGDEERPDILGAAIRFRSNAAISEVPSPGDQDLLMATFAQWWMMPFGPMTTDPHSFLANDFHGVLPFDVEGLGRAYLTLRSPHLGAEGLKRRDALELATQRGLAVFQLMAKPEEDGAAEQEVAMIKLVRRVEINQAALRFDPFRSGRGIVPRGFFQAMRRATYLASQLGRPRH